MRIFLQIAILADQAAPLGCLIARDFFDDGGGIFLGGFAGGAAAKLSRQECRRQDGQDLLVKGVTFFSWVDVVALDGEVPADIFVSPVCLAVSGAVPFGHELTW